MSASTTLTGSWFQTERRMLVEKMMSCTLVLVCGTRNRSERLWFEERWCSAGTFKYISTRLYTAVHHHWRTLICSVVSATGVAVAWLWQCLCAGNLQWQTWQLDVVLPRPCWYCLFYWGSISLIRIFHWEISIL